VSDTGDGRPATPPPPPPAPPGWGAVPPPGWAPAPEPPPPPPPPPTPQGWFGAFVTCPICSTAIPPGYQRCPTCNCSVAPPPRPSRATLVRLGTYVAAVYVAALLLVLAFR
jgi:hypothetical protein